MKETLKQRTLLDCITTYSKTRKQTDAITRQSTAYQIPCCTLPPVHINNIKLNGSLTTK